MRRPTVLGVGAWALSVCESLDGTWDLTCLSFTYSTKYPFTWKLVLSLREKALVGFVLWTSVDALTSPISVTKPLTLFVCDGINSNNQKIKKKKKNPHL